jgi:uncharacterized membrane protein
VGDSDRGLQPPGITQIQAYRWTSSGGMLALPVLNDYVDSIAHAVSADGTVVVGTSSRFGGSEATIWSPFFPFGLGHFAGGHDSGALDVSPDGSVVVGYSGSASGRLPFRWTSATGLVSLGQPGTATAVSGDGQIVVGEGDGAFIWDADNGMRDLRDLLINQYGLGAVLQDWTLTRATDVSADGTTLVGIGVNPDGLPEAWRVQFAGSASAVPEPATVVLLTVGVIGRMLLA